MSVMNISRRIIYLVIFHLLTFKNRFIMKKVLLFLCFMAAVAVASVAFSSCNVTRVITNESMSIQRGDTAVVIQTKTIETYDATSKGLIR